jgi:hypothetical protein
MKLSLSKFKLKPSIIGNILFLIIHAGALFCAFFVPALLFKLFLTFCILKNYLEIADRFWAQGKNHIKEFWYDEEGRWVLQKTAGDLLVVTINWPCFITNYLIVLNFSSRTKEKISLLVFKDSLAKEDFRKLKINLKANLKN